MCNVQYCQRNILRYSNTKYASLYMLIERSGSKRDVPDLEPHSEVDPVAEL